MGSLLHSGHSLLSFNLISRRTRYRPTVLPPPSEDDIILRSFVLTQYRCVADRQTHGRTDRKCYSYTARSCKSPPVKIQYAKHHTDLYRSIWSICPRVKWQAPILKTLLITVRRTREKLSELRCCVVQHNCILSCNSYWWTSPVYLSYKFGFCHVFVFFLSWCRLGLVVTATVWKDLSPDWRMTYRVEGQTSPRFMDSHVIADFIRVCFWPQIGLFRLQLKQKWS